MKAKAIEVLREAVDAVNRAMEAIDHFAEEQKIARQPMPKPGSTMTMGDFSDMIAGLIGKDPECVDHIIRTAFYTMKDMKLIITEDDEDDEDEEDEDDE